MSNNRRPQDRRAQVKSEQEASNEDLIEIYDHNRNLDLQDSEEKGEHGDQANTRLEHHDHHDRVSPVLSLVDSDCTSSSNSASTSSNVNERATNAVHHSSSSSGSTRLICSPPDSLTHDSEQTQPRSRRVSFDRIQDDSDAKQQVLIDMFDAQNCAAQLGDQRRHEDSERDRLTAPHASDRRTSKVDGATGRRMSLLRAFLARRLSRQSNGGNKQVRNEMRRFSLQLRSRSSAADDDGGRALSRRASANACDSAPTNTVAGVGGTVVTVTRKTRKTAPLPRLVAKNGQVNLFFDNIDRRQYFRDLFVTMIDIKWRYNLAAAAFGFVLSWLFFACVWYAVLFIHDDLEHENDPSWSPCIVNVHSFAAALLFSIETQSTLGFGSRIISVECPGAIVIFCTQLIFGVVVECLIVGMVFAKLTRPAKRSQTIMYSKCATICLREDQLCLTFRVGDVRSKSHIIGATIRASLVSQKITREGEIIPFFHNQLNVTIDNSNSLLLIWPVTIVHLIDETSPFYTLSAHQLLNFKFELITVLEGTVESTGQSIQVRSSYLPSEVKWGHRFEPIVSAHGFGRNAQTIIDYNKFNRTIEVDTPTCCARDYYAQRARAKSDSH